MSGMYLTRLVLKEITERPVQYAGRALRQRRRMALGAESLARCLDANELDVGVRNEGVKDSHRVRAAADTRDDRRRQAASMLHHLRARFNSDNRLKVAHHSRVRRRSDDGAD